MKDYFFKALVAFASLSLGVNSFFVKTTVEQMRDDTTAIRADFKELSKSLQDVRLDIAVKDSILNNVRSRVEICEARIDRLEVERGRR